MRPITRLPKRITLHALLWLSALGLSQTTVADTRATPPVSGTQYTLRHSEGAPQGIRLSDDGLQLWEYSASRSRPPMEVRFDREGRVAGARWLRGSEDFAQVAGQRLTMSQALALLGQPDAVAVDAGAVAWRYRRPDGTTTVVRFGADGRASVEQ